MPTVFSTSPYYDDYDQTKQFYRILFRPGRAVQGRELTQLQTIVQGQIERFGKGIYQDGSFVTPPKDVLDTRYNFVKLDASYNSIVADTVVGSLFDKIVVGQTSGVRALVINSTTSNAAGDPPTIYVKYLNSGTSGTAVGFVAGEVITSVDNITSVKAVDSAPIGYGTAYSVGECVVFAKGSFLYIDDQTYIVSKYGTARNLVLGFQITESVVTSDDDESLLDPAVGSFNYFAPGADRYKIGVALAQRELTVAESDDPNFIEILRIQNGLIVSRNSNPKFSVLGDTLARRTYDESGDYVVKPYKIELIEHLRSSNVYASIGSSRDGLYNSDQGGNANYYVSIVSPGKAYVKGYEVENISTKYVNLEKARDFSSINNGVVSTQLSSYVTVSNVRSLPNINDVAEVELYNDFNAVSGVANGTKVGTAKIRGLQYASGNAQANAAVFNLYLFDINMESGYSFERNVKQFYSSSTPNFTANLYPTLTLLTGTVSVTSGSDLVTGSGTLFNSEIVSGDFIRINNVDYKVSNVVSNSQFYSSRTAPSSASGQLARLTTATVFDSDKDSYIIPFPYSTIKSVDPTNSETIYTTKRAFTRTCSSGFANVTLGTDESFTPFAVEDYQAVISSGARSGEYLVLNSSKVSRSGSSLETVSFNLSGDGLTTETVKLYTTIQKTGSSAIRKTKTLVTSANVDYTSASSAQSLELTVGKADVFKLRSVRMSNVSFGSSFTHAGSVDITDRYTLDNGQRSTYYDLGRLKLKPGRPKPTNPIRITFDYFTHGAGDYFSVNSYSDIDYEDIPEVTIGSKTYKLRDCLDFRPRKNDLGSGFSGAGSSTTEFIDPEVDFITDYQYYLPRTDKLIINTQGTISQLKGVSSLDPKEPRTPDDSLTLFVLKQKPYVFNAKNDVDVIEIDNRRFTMRDIGKIENRVKNLEYYTSLNLLEVDAQQLQIRDEFGFERFKNGFIVDNFTGHGVGDSQSNPDYSVAINYTKKEASPLVKSKFVNLVELAQDNSIRTSNNYVRTGDLITLPYTSEVIIENSFASKTESINPFNVTMFQGVVTLTPPIDIWFDDQKAPDILVDYSGDFDNLSQTSSLKRDGNNFFGSVSDIEQFRCGVVPAEGPDFGGAITSGNPANRAVANQVVVNVAVAPKMRNVAIRFDVDGMKPNTRLYAFFENEPVSVYCKPLTDNMLSSNVTIVYQAIESQTNNHLITDSTGSIRGVFYYNSSILNFNTGRKVFKLTDNPNNYLKDETTFAEATFDSSGLLRETADVVLVRPPPPPIPVVNNITNITNVTNVTNVNNTNITNVTNNITQIVQQNDPPTPTPPVSEPPVVDEPIVVPDPPEPPAPPPDPPICESVVCRMYRVILGREYDDGGAGYWTGVGNSYGLNMISTIGGELNDPAGVRLLVEFIYGAWNNNEQDNPGSMLYSTYQNLKSTYPPGGAVAINIDEFIRSLADVSSRLI